MNGKQPDSKRVYRELTPAEQQRLQRARLESETSRELILKEARRRKRAWEATRQEVGRTVAALRSQRELLGLSLADIEARSGLKRSALSRLENDPDANPTFFTLQRYATAMDLTLSALVVSAPSRQRSADGQ